MSYIYFLIALIHWMRGTFSKLSKCSKCTVIYPFTALGILLFFTWPPVACGDLESQSIAARSDASPFRFANRNMQCLICSGIDRKSTRRSLLAKRRQIHTVYRKFPIYREFESGDLAKVLQKNQKGGSSIYFFPRDLRNANIRSFSSLHLGQLSAHSLPLALCIYSVDDTRACDDEGKKKHSGFGNRDFRSPLLESVPMGYLMEGCGFLALACALGSALFGFSCINGEDWRGAAFGFAVGILLLWLASFLIHSGLDLTDPALNTLGNDNKGANILANHDSVRPKKYGYPAIWYSIGKDDWMHNYPGRCKP